MSSGGLFGNLLLMPHAALIEWRQIHYNINFCQAEKGFHVFIFVQTIEVYLLQPAINL